MHHDLDIGTIPCETNLCLCAHQRGELTVTLMRRRPRASLGVLSIAVLLLVVALVFLLLQKDPTRD